MNKEEFIKLINEKYDIIDAKKFDNINHKPHPYCLTPKHIDDRYVYINEATIREQEKAAGHGLCGMYVNGDKCYNEYKAGYTRCTLTHDEHTYNTVIWIQQIKSCTLDNINEVLNNIINLAKEHELKFDGFAFITPPEGVIFTDYKPKQEEKTNDTKDGSL